MTEGPLVKRLNLEVDEQASINESVAAYDELDDWVKSRLAQLSRPRPNP